MLIAIFVGCVAIMVDPTIAVRGPLILFMLCKFCFKSLVVWCKRMGRAFTTLSVGLAITRLTDSMGSGPDVEMNGRVGAHNCFTADPECEDRAEVFALLIGFWRFRSGTAFDGCC